MKTQLFAVLTMTAVLAMTSTGWAQGVDTNSAELPADAPYVTHQQYFEYSGFGITVDGAVLTPDAGGAIRTPVGDDEIESFDAVLSGVEIGQGLGPITLTGPVQVRTTDRLLGTTGNFNAEIVSAGFSGNTPLGVVMIRQDPQRPSTGQTDIADLGGGLYHIDSFFDVFTEVSLDGGSTWLPADYSTRMTLTPEPGTLGLLAFGGMAVLRRRRRKR